MKKRLWDKQIPSVFAVLFLLAGVWVTAYLVGKGVFFVSRASPDEVPQNVRITNITDSSFTVSYTTTQKTTGAIQVVQSDGSETLVKDDRDKNSAQPGEYFAHFITVPEVFPETEYSFQIVSGSQEFTSDEEPYSVRTGPPIAEGSPDQKPLFGTVLLPDGQKGSDTIVHVTIDGKQEVSALTNEKGEYLIPMNSLRNDILSSYATLSPETEISLEALQKKSISHISIFYKDAENIPPITLENDYDFKEDETIESDATPSSELTAPTPATASETNITLTSPTTNQSFVDTQPVFSGTALPNTTVEIVIESDPITTSVQADRNGRWTFRPSVALAQGQHTITVRTRDANGIMKEIKQAFSIFPVGSQVAEAATPSATLTPTRTPTPTLASISLTPSPTGSVSAVPTLITVTPSPTFTPTPTQFISVPTATLPPAGSNTTVALTVTSVLFIFTGAILLFFLA